MQKYFQLLISFLKCGLLAFGGGTSAVPLLENEIVNNMQLLSSQQFSSIYAIGQSLPGPIVTKLATIIGYQIAGVPGMLISIISIVAPSTIICLFIYHYFMSNTHTYDFESIIRYTQPVIVVMILRLLINQFNVMIQNNSAPYTYTGLFILACVYLICLKGNPLYMILFSIVVGYVNR